jgi:hypothetical protein
MRVLFLYCSAILTALGVGELVVNPNTLRLNTSSALPTLKNSTRNVLLPGRQVDTNPPPNNPNLPPLEPQDPLWVKAVCNGRKLYRAMVHDVAEAVNFVSPITSPFDGTMEQELEQWGWNDVSGPDFDDECDFDEEHHLVRAFDEMNVDTKSSADEGPNHCFRVEHYDGKTVKRPPGSVDPPVLEEQRFDGPDGKEYRVSADDASIWNSYQHFSLR